MTGFAERGTPDLRVTSDEGSPSAGRGVARDPWPKGQAAKFSALSRLVADSLESKGQRFTERRQLILEKLFASEAHLSVDELLLQVRAVDPRVSYATVYRLLRTLAEAGILAEHHFGDGCARYDVAEGVHHERSRCRELR